MKRQIVLDTETTGLEPSEGHRIIEIGCVELLNRRFTGNNLHFYLKPDRDIDSGALEVHGITNTFLADKPRFKQVVEELMAYIKGAELVIHNAPFDVGFLNHELALMRSDWGKIENHCEILDTLVVARKKHPGQRNSLDALCKRYGVNNTERTLHGALLDAEILADVYLAMTSGQTILGFNKHDKNDINAGEHDTTISNLSDLSKGLLVQQASSVELDAHKSRLSDILSESGQCIWLGLEPDSQS